MINRTFFTYLESGARLSANDVPTQMRQGKQVSQRTLASHLLALVWTNSVEP